MALSIWILYYTQPIASENGNFPFHVFPNNNIKINLYLCSFQCYELSEKCCLLLLLLLMLLLNWFGQDMDIIVYFINTFSFLSFRFRLHSKDAVAVLETIRHKAFLHLFVCNFVQVIFISFYFIYQDARFFVTKQIKSHCAGFFYRRVFLIVPPRSKDEWQPPKLKLILSSKFHFTHIILYSNPIRFHQA